VAYFSEFTLQKWVPIARMFSRDRFLDEKEHRRMIGASSSANPLLPFPEAETANTLLFMESLIDEALVTAENSQAHTETLTRKRESAMLHAALTQATRANDSLREGMTALIETSAQPTCVLDREGTVTVWNRAIRHLTGITGGRAFGQTLEELFAGCSIALLTDTIGDLLRLGALPGGLESSAPRRLSEPVYLFSYDAPLTITLLPVCLVSGCLDTLIVLVEA
jgi:PAS domain-containing protein